MDLVDFLLARSREDELRDWHERSCPTNRRMPPGSPLGLGGAPMTCKCPVPDRMEREALAKRRIVELHRRTSRTESWPTGDREVVECAVCATTEHEYAEEWTRHSWPCDTLRLLALPHADHPDYQEGWAP